MAAKRANGLAVESTKNTTSGDVKQNGQGEERARFKWAGDASFWLPQSWRGAVGGLVLSFAGAAVGRASAPETPMQTTPPVGSAVAANASESRLRRPDGGTGAGASADCTCEPAEWKRFEEYMHKAERENTTLAQSQTSKEVRAEALSRLETFIDEMERVDNTAFTPSQRLQQYDRIALMRTVALEFLSDERAKKTHIERALARLNLVRAEAQQVEKAMDDSWLPQDRIEHRDRLTHLAFLRASVLGFAYGVNAATKEQVLEAIREIPESYVKVHPLSQEACFKDFPLPARYRSAH